MLDLLPFSTFTLIITLALTIIVFLGLWLNFKSRALVTKPYHLATAKYTDVGPFRIHYVQEGRGPHILLIHGLGATTYCWRFIFTELSKNYTVTALDLPGFGLSSKLVHEGYGLDAQTNRLTQFCKQLEIEQCRLVGCSMGGAIALWMAKKHPRRFFEVALIAPATNPKRVPVAIKNLNWSSGILKFGVSRQLIKLIMSRVFTRKTLINDESIQQSLVIYQDPRAIKVFIKATELIRDARLPKKLSNISSRKLILYGQKDKIIPEKYIQELEKVLPPVVRANHPEGGHHVMEDEPEWTLNQLQLFFGSTEI